MLITSMLQRSSTRYW